MKTPTRTQSACKNMAVNRAPEECYRFWHDFANLPRFMKHVETVQVSGDKPIALEVKIAGGKTLEWDAEITSDVPDRAIEWRSVGATDIENSGSVRFEPKVIRAWKPHPGRD